MTNDEPLPYILTTKGIRQAIFSFIKHPWPAIKAIPFAFQHGLNYYAILLILADRLLEEQKQYNARRPTT